MCQRPCRVFGVLGEGGPGWVRIEKTTMASNRQYKSTATVFFWEALEPLLELRGFVQEGVADPALVYGS